MLNDDTLIYFVILSPASEWSSKGRVFGACI